MLTAEIIKQLPLCSVLATINQEEDEEAWLQTRTKGIGGSDVGPICGVSPYSSAVQVYFAKTGMYDEKFGVDNAAKDRMHFGHMLEPVVADEFVLRTGLQVIDIDCTLQSNETPWALANVDRLIIEDGKVTGILECKTASEYMNDEWLEGDLPLTYVYQLQWYMYVTGIHHGYFAALVGGNKFYIYEVFYDEVLVHERLLPSVDQFWNGNVKKLVVPEMQSTDKDVVNELYKDCIKGSEISFIEDNIVDDIVTTIQNCKKKIKELESIQTEAENRLKDKLQNHEIGYTQHYVVKWSPQSQRRVDTTKLKGQYPKVYEECTKTIEFKKLTIKGGLD